MATYNKVKFQNELIGWRNVLTQRIIDLYTPEPYDDEELSQIAGDIIKNKQVVEEILADVKKQRAKSKGLNP